MLFWDEFGMNYNSLEQLKTRIMFSIRLIYKMELADNDHLGLNMADTDDHR
jgi:hypothetical protein